MKGWIQDMITSFHADEATITLVKCKIQGMYFTIIADLNNNLVTFAIHYIHVIRMWRAIEFKFRLILDSSVGFWVDNRSTGDLVSQTFHVRIRHSAEEDDLSHFDSVIACLRKSININNNTHVYYFTQYEILLISTHIQLQIITFINPPPQWINKLQNILSFCVLLGNSSFLCIRMAVWVGDAGVTSLSTTFLSSSLGFSTGIVRRHILFP